MQKKIPKRKCCGCGEDKPKKELIRIVRSPEGVISTDATGKKPGRGAYICPYASCLNKAKKAKKLERAFECPIPEEVYQSLELALTP
ncbi:MAG TPA: DUF448 domain-containing protein [Clostridiales bacterium]|nr:DUF448 domain-containing protein [Clostridiales bacterium]HCG35163.1 DUF448 domain-containing protein [Clostridiales bacterium]